MSSASKGDWGRDMSPLVFLLMVSIALPVVWITAGAYEMDIFGALLVVLVWLPLQVWLVAHIIFRKNKLSKCFWMSGLRIGNTLKRNLENDGFIVISPVIHREIPNQFPGFRFYHHIIRTNSNDIEVRLYLKGRRKYIITPAGAKWKHQTMIYIGPIRKDNRVIVMKLQQLIDVSLSTQINSVSRVQ